MEPLFPDMRSDTNVLFKLRFAGPSFNGTIELSTLAQELSGLNYCLNRILSESIRAKCLDVGPFEYEFIVTPFEKGSVWTYVKAVGKELGKPKNVANDISSTVSGIFILVAANMIMPQANQTSTTPTFQQIKAELLEDKEYINSMAKIASGLQKQDDTVSFNSERGISFEINNENKRLFTGAEVDDYKYYGEQYESLDARVVMVNLNARTNSIAVRVSDGGPQVECSFRNPPSDAELKEILDKWIKIKGISLKLNGIRKHIDIFEYEVFEPPVQIAANFKSIE